MFKHIGFVLALVVVSSLVLAEVQVLYPVESNLKPGATIQVGDVQPNQVFELVFSDNSSLGFEWDTIEVYESSLPSGWRVVSTESTDVSLVAKIEVPRTANPNFYVMKLFFSNSTNPTVRESINVSVVVKHNLLDVSFSRPSLETISVVGESVSYNAIVSNSSIASQKIVFSSDLPSNWFEEIEYEAKPNTTQEVELRIDPRSYGKQSFVFQVLSDEGQILKTYSSELNVRPTLKGKFSSALTGFPFFTFSLVPFQLADSLLSIIIPS